MTTDETLKANAERTLHIETLNTAIERANTGRTAEALKILDTAYKARPDAEIAAHLGEVLWASGQRDRAHAIWKEGLLLNSENETLQETLKRLRVRP